MYMIVQLLQTKDQTYTTTLAALLTFPETASGFLVLGLPVFPTFFNSTIAKIFPELPIIFKNIKERLFPKREALPHAYPARENEGKNKRQQRSLWYISTNFSIQQSNIERIEGEIQLNNTSLSESKIYLEV